MNLSRREGELQPQSSSKSRPEGVDDEESTQKTTSWAAIERLPTRSRITRGLLLAHDQYEDEEQRGGQNREVEIMDVNKLKERKNFLGRLVKINAANADNDNNNEKKWLLNLKNRMDRVGLEFPATEVRFEHLHIEAAAYVGSRASPTMLNFSVNMFEGFLNCFHILSSKKKPLPILHDANGIIKPRRMTLLLGPPGSGKTTLLLALAGKFDKDNLKISGRVTYNGQGMGEFVPQRAAAYVSQHDLHLPELTVRETLDFSARCQGVGPRYDMLVELLRREKAANIMPDLDLDLIMKAAVLGQETHVVTDLVLKVLGLEACADTVVGDEMNRGISGGQKKRVTTGEMLVGPQRVLFMDEISTGLDSSTTFQIVNSLRQYIHILNGTALISLLQPAPETYDLFDDIILLSDGNIVYQGPCENVLEFFEHMGFKCPERKGIADFLQEVTSRKDQEQYWVHRDMPYGFVTTKEFSEAMKSFHIGRRLGDELAIPFNKSEGHPEALTTKKYGVSGKELFKACMHRQILLIRRNKFVYIFKLMQLIVAALVTTTLFLHIDMHRRTLEDGGIYMGALFYTLLSIMLNGFTELHMTVERLPMFFKQRDHLFYPAWAYSLPQWMIRIPMTFVEVGIWMIITYYSIGYDPSIGRFFKQFLLLVCISQMANGLFRLIGALGRNITVANTFGFAALLFILGLGGFVLSRADMNKWTLWGYYVSPFTYGLNAIAVNEFLGESWRHVPASSTEPLGIIALKSRGVFAEAQWYWIGVAALTGFVLLFNLLFNLALQYLDPLEKPQAAVSNEALSAREGSEEIAANRTRHQGMVLPFKPISVTFDDIRYAIDMPQEMKDQGITEGRKEILKGVSGTFRPGVLTALMGVSGAGKTTLLDVLAGRKTGGYIEGTMTLSGYPKKQETFARVTGYCEQTDIHSPHITTYESLVHSAWLRLSPEVDYQNRRMFIEEVMELVELTTMRDALVGLPGVNGLSTEQRKRLTIAVELVANPSIIFMDEPTSGLDARAAAIVMRTVRNTVDTGRTVVCTIHQPSIDIFDVFDEMLLLKQGGEEIYVGPLGHHSSMLIEYFAGIRGVPKIRDGYNPATWMLEITSAAKEEALGVNFADIYKNSEIYRTNKALIRELSTPAPNSEDLYFPTQYSRSFFTQCLACLWKQHLSYWKNPQYSAVRLFFTAMMALLFGTIFWDLGSKRQRQRDLFNALGSMYAAVLFIGIQNSLSVQPVVGIERMVFYRERAVGMYSAFPFAFGQAVIEIPYTLIQTIIYAVIVYSMVGFDWTVSKFFWYLFFMYFTFLCFTFHGMMMAAITPNNIISAVVSSSIFPFWNVISGFLIPKTRIPIWWRWFYWISPTSWSLYGLFSSQFGGVMDTLDSGETVDHFISTYFGYRKDFLDVVAIVLIGFSVVFVFIFALGIKALNFQKR